MSISLSLFLMAAQATTGSGAKPCSPAVYKALTAPAAEAERQFNLNCSVTLRRGDSIPRRLVITGARASGVSIDCNGGAIGYPGIKASKAAPTVAIWSQQTGPSTWSRPTDIAIRRCHIYGAVRLWGIGVASIPDQIRESRLRDYTARAQRAAPTRVTVRDSVIEGNKSIPVYIGPGSTAFTLRDSKIVGNAVAAMYLDAESARNRIENNVFDLKVDRTAIAIDGSADNIVTGNVLPLGHQAGIQLYRNCGERGVIRHQAPRGNRITNNRFVGDMPGARAVMENARSTLKRKPGYCGQDAGYSFGSSANDGDNAANNTIQSNRIVKR